MFILYILNKKFMHKTYKNNYNKICINIKNFIYILYEMYHFCFNISLY